MILIPNHHRTKKKMKFLDLHHKYLLATPTEP